MDPTPATPAPPNPPPAEPAASTFAKIMACVTHTNMSGLAGLACALGAIWGPPEYQQKFAASAVAAGAYFAGHAKGSENAD